jgi:hypothetical protein
MDWRLQGKFLGVEEKIGVSACPNITYGIRNFVVYRDASKKGLGSVIM